MTQRVLMGMFAALCAWPALAAGQFQTAPPPPPTPLEQTGQLERFERARANLEALRTGRLGINDLTQQDLQDVIDFDRRLRGDVVDTRTPSQQCVDDEVRRAGRRPTRLAWRVIELKCR